MPGTPLKPDGGIGCGQDEYERKRGEKAAQVLTYSPYPHHLDSLFPDITGSKEVEKASENSVNVFRNRAWN